MRRQEKIYPIILAAGPCGQLGFPKALARFGAKTAVQIAVENCAGLEKPLVVLGDQAARVRRAVPAPARVVVHRAWRAGQLSSLRAGLGRIPRRASFLLYPVDLPLLTPLLIRRLAAAFQNRKQQHAIVVPICRRRQGHPVLFSAGVRGELRQARTAKELVYRDLSRVKFVPVATPAIWRDFDSPASYRQMVREVVRQRGSRTTGSTRRSSDFC